MKMTIKKISITSALFMSVTLVACSGNNPLQTQPKDQALAFVEEASKTAETQLHIKAFPPGNTYYACMTDDGMVDKRQNPHVCEDVYDAMITYARTTNSAFKNITLSELQDQKAFRPLYNIPLDSQ